MTLAQVNEILTGTFEDDADREYWERKREELTVKEERAKENAAYFRKMSKYNR